MKYIFFKDFSGDEVPVIFPSRVKFDEMREQIPYSQAVSAGFVQLKDGRLICHGEARDLELQSRPGDGDLMAEKLSDAES